MTKRHVVLFFIVAAFGGYGCSSVMSRLLSAILPWNPIAYGFWAPAFFLLCIWFYEDVKKEIRIRDQERQAIVDHDLKKRSVILSKHPLHDPERDVMISSTKQLEWYYEEHLDDVADMDWDKNGQYIFRNHKYVRK